MRIVIGSDHYGYRLKESLKRHLVEVGYEPVDVGCFSEDPVDYPDVAEALGERVSAGEFERGVLVCGTGIGMAIVANKFPGVRAAVGHDPYSAERARASNNAQIICFGAQIVGPGVADKLLDVWLGSEFQGGRSLRKVEKICRIDDRFRAESAPGK
jgi:ribose 5-phosphate isomerase B